MSFESEAYSRQIKSMRKRFETMVDLSKVGLRVAGLASRGTWKPLQKDFEGPGKDFNSILGHHSQV